jgi:nicotinamide riboside kinase
MKKIAIIGPESTGKTALAQHLAHSPGGAWVPEFAREYLTRLGRPYTEADLLEIAKGQLDLEKKIEKNTLEWLICDTNLVVILIWSQDKFGRIAPALERLFRPEAYDIHLLLKPDLPWEYDPLREDPDRLEALFEVYRDFLEARGIDYAIVVGSGEKRLERATELLSSFF